MIGSILIVDDEASLLDFLSVLCTSEGLQVATARSVREAREQLAERTPDLVLCDMMMPDGNGLDLLKEIKGGESRTSVIMMTAYTSTKNAIDAMKLGAYDYVPKPFDIDELKAVLQRALEKNRLYEENTYLRRELEQRYAFKNIIGRSPRMQAIFGLIERVARTASTVLIHGESGTGKELIARAIHFSSPRATQRVLSINCGAMPENLLESELFGHERGAFTGALRDKKGLFQEANHGTLFLDEIGEMSLPMQVKLLRVLQEKVVRRVGGIERGSGGRPDHRGHQPESGGEDRPRGVPRGSVLPHQRHSDLDSAAARAAGGHPAAGRPLPAQVQRRPGRAAEAHLGRGHAPPRRAQLARQRARAREPDRARDRPLDRQRHHRRGPSHLARRLRTRATNRGSRCRPRASISKALLEGIRADVMRQALERSGGVQTQAAELLRMSFRSFRYYARKAGITGVQD